MNWVLHTLTIHWNGSWSWRRGFNSSKDRNDTWESRTNRFEHHSRSWSHGFGHSESWGTGDTSSVMDEVM